MKLNINDEQGIDLLHFIFERELKPPFIRYVGGHYGEYDYYNRDDEYIGQYNSNHNYMEITFYPLMDNIYHKVCQAFGFPYDAPDWREAIEPHLKSWMENHLNMYINWIDY